MNNNHHHLAFIEDFLALRTAIVSIIVFHLKIVLMKAAGPI